VQHLRTPAVLRRFAAIFPDKPFAAELNTTELMRLQQADPDLAALVMGTATASLELQVLEGNFSDTYTAPTPEQLKAQRVQEILAQNPGGQNGYYRQLPDGSSEYVQPQEANMSLMLELSQLDHDAWQQQEAIRKPPAPVEGVITADEAARINAAVAAERVASLNHANTLVSGGSN